MNRQDIWKDGKLIKRGIEWTQVYGRPGYTANPIRGCVHGCEWLMPDGSWAICYAKPIGDRFYPGGFENITFHPEELEAISRKKEGAGIFIDSMSDLFGAKVPDDWIIQVLQCIHDNPQHIFLSLTKNPPRLRQIRHLSNFPKNMWVGISAPPTKMFGKELTTSQQIDWLERGLECLTTVDAYITWMSIEPLSFDIAPLIQPFVKELSWAVVGAASNGSKKFQPDYHHLVNVLEVLRDTSVFFKGNIDRELARLVGGWREEFPALTHEVHELKQMAQEGKLL